MMELLMETYLTYPFGTPKTGTILLLILRLLPIIFRGG